MPPKKPKYPLLGVKPNFRTPLKSQNPECPRKLSKSLIPPKEPPEICETMCKQSPIDYLDSCSLRLLRKTTRGKPKARMPPGEPKSPLLHRKTNSRTPPKGQNPGCLPELSQSLIPSDKSPKTSVKFRYIFVTMLCVTLKTECLHYLAI